MAAASSAAFHRTNYFMCCCRYGSTQAAFVDASEAAFVALCRDGGATAFVDGNIVFKAFRHYRYRIDGDGDSYYTYSGRMCSKSRTDCPIYNTVIFPRQLQTIATFAYDLIVPEARRPYLTDNSLEGYLCNERRPTHNVPCALCGETNVAMLSATRGIALRLVQAIAVSPTGRHDWYEACASINSDTFTRNEAVAAYVERLGQKSSLCSQAIMQPEHLVVGCHNCIMTAKLLVCGLVTRCTDRLEHTTGGVAKYLRAFHALSHMLKDAKCINHERYGCMSSPTLQPASFVIVGSAPVRELQVRIATKKRIMAMQQMAKAAKPGGHGIICFNCLAVEDLRAHILDDAHGDALEDVSDDEPPPKRRHVLAKAPSAASSSSSSSSVAPGNVRVVVPACTRRGTGAPLVHLAPPPA